MTTTDPTDPALEASSEPLQPRPASIRIAPPQSLKPASAPLEMPQNGSASPPDPDP
jgi:hypothetical protein